MKKSKDGWIAAAGMLLMMVGAGLLGRIEPLAYVCIGLGAGLFGQGTGELVSRWALRNSPEIRKQLEIAQKDERNQAIASQAKSKAFDMMTFSFGALMLVFALMQVDLAALLMLVFVYLLVHGYAVYWHCRYEKEM